MYREESVLDIMQKIFVLFTEKNPNLKEHTKIITYIINRYNQI